MEGESPTQEKGEKNPFVTQLGEEKKEQLFGQHRNQRKKENVSPKFRWP